MSHEVKFERIITEEQFRKLNEFGKEFNHEIPPLRHPMLVAKFNGEWVGYFQIVQTIPIVFPAFNPNRCSSRKTFEVMRAFQGWAKIEHGSGIVAVPMDSKTFTPEVMEKNYFTRRFNEIYETSN